jgi:putative SOS response-associated peptidase YedK
MSWIVTYTVIPCEPNKSVGELHDRDDALKIWPVDNTVGNVKNTGPQTDQAA